MSPGSQNSENQSISVGNSLLPNTLLAPPRGPNGTRSVGNTQHVFVGTPRDK